MCGKLLQLVQSADTALAGSRHRLTFFESGTNYFVVGVPTNYRTPPPPNTIRTGWSVLWVIAGGNKPYIKGRLAV